MTHPTLCLDQIPSPLGPLSLVTDDSGRLCALDFEEFEARMHRLLSRYHGAPRLVAGAAPFAITQALAGYFEGEVNALAQVPVHTGGTPFQQQVWQALRQIAPGATRSYGELAAQLGRPTASRAVGMANGANPVALVLPCHRVIGRSGALTGYAGGLARKAWLLAHEARQAGVA